MARSNMSIAEFTRLGTRPRLYIIMGHMRAFVRAYGILLEHRHYSPLTKRNEEFHLLDEVTFAGTTWSVISIPRRDFAIASAAAKPFGLRLANGIPYALENGAMTTLVSGRNLEHTTEGAGFIPFPLNGRDVYTIEYDADTDTGRMLGASRDRKLLWETEAKAVRSIYESVAMQPELIDILMKEWEIKDAPGSAPKGSTPPPSSAESLLNAFSLEEAELLRLGSYDFVKETLESEGFVAGHVQLWGDPMPANGLPYETFHAVDGDGERTCYVVHFDTRVSKAMFSDSVRKVADLIHANAVVTVLDAWRLRNDPRGQEAHRWILDHGRRLEDHPDRMSIVSFSFELPGMMSLSYAEIFEEDGGKRRLGPLEEWTPWAEIKRAGASRAEAPSQGGGADGEGTIEAKGYFTGFLKGNR